MNRALFLAIPLVALAILVAGQAPTSTAPVAPAMPLPSQPLTNPMDYRYLPQAKGIAEIAPQWRHLNKMGSCVHCSTANCLEYMGLHEEAKEWRATYIGGESPGPHLQKLQKSGYKFVMTTGRDTADQWLDWIIATRRCAGVADKPSHCRNFMGKIEKDGKSWAVILDNNPPLRPHLEDFNSWHSGWIAQGGWGFTIVSGELPPPLPTN